MPAHTPVMDGLEACWTVRTDVEMGNLLIDRWMERTTRRTGQLLCTQKRVEVLQDTNTNISGLLYQ